MSNPAIFLFGKAHSVGRAIVAAATAVALVLLISLAITHHHLVPDRDHGCTICSVVAEKIAGPAAVATHTTIALVALPLEAACATALIVRPTPHLLPPGCGPPARG